MQTRYLDLIEQTFEFPQEEFHTENNRLYFHEVDLNALIAKYGTPLKFTYLPIFGRSINRARKWFEQAFHSIGYEGSYHYCYCTKSSHFHFVMDEVLKNGAHLETSSDFDIDIIKHLANSGKIRKDHFILCNGFKSAAYINNIASLINQGYKNTIPVIDNYSEINLLTAGTHRHFNIGIRIASEEDPKFPFYTSRLGIGYQNIVDFYRDQILRNENISLKLLHFFINTGISDTAYYWNELGKCLEVYCQLKKICPSLNSLDIGGGFPIKNSLGFEFDYQYMVTEIVQLIKSTCNANGVKEPNIFTEFGSFTVGESTGVLFQVLYQKSQNDREKWNMIDSSIMTTLPDTWAINKRFVMLPINRWDDEYERVMLGGLTCDSDDYYNSEQHVNAIYLPKFDQAKPLYIGFFNIGAYQDTIGGYGGIHHCLIPQPRHVLIDEKMNSSVFSEMQGPEEMLNILGYQGE
jgi:arginine decarboxylase